MSGYGANGAIELTHAASGAPSRRSLEPADGARVKELAAKFEAILLLQMIREMRRAGKWDDDAPQADGLGAETYFETIDIELANHLSSIKGLGLSGQLLDAFERAAAPRAAGHAQHSQLAVGESAGAIQRGLQHTAAASAASIAAPDLNPAAAQISSLQYAIEPGSVTSQYGWRNDPFTGQATFHRGIDLRAAYGQDVRAAGPGRVAFSGDQGGYGTTVVLQHANGLQTRYAHLSAVTVHAGDVVTAGQVIGRAGKSGRATGTHLHFEVTVNGRPVPPSEAGLVPAPDGGSPAR